MRLNRLSLALTLSLLSDPALDALITGEDVFEDLPEVQARLAKAPETPSVTAFARRRARVLNGASPNRLDSVIPGDPDTPTGGDIYERRMNLAIR